MEANQIRVMDYRLTLDESESIIENGKLVILNDEKCAIFNKCITKKY